MKVYIEVVMFIIAILFFILWMVWFNFTRWLAKRRYNPNNDKSRQGEDKRRAKIGSREYGTETAVGNLPRNEPIREQQLLQDAEVIVPEQISRSPRKNSSGIRKLLRRRR